MKTTYNPNAIEEHWAEYWEQQKLYRPESAPAKASGNYAITLPPPNVTGTLHMGHGFQMTLMDALIRRQRMQGKHTLWQPGTDHAGIATQMVVERELAKEHKTRHDLGREKFIDRVWSWREQSGSAITQQIRRLGASLDWSRERFSMDEQLSTATQTAFIKLYEDGLIYRGKRLVNWDPKLNTAVSDLEVFNKESNGSLWYIRYPIKDNFNEHLVVATTRPETMLGDTAVAVHPEDERYAKFIGQHISLPLTNRLIPIIADEHVDPEFGTGCVKVTPAHDFNDYEIGKRHNLAMINILTLDAHINDQAPTQYQGLERFAARKRIVKDLEAADLLEKIEPYTLQVPIGDRSGVVIEPMLTDQWFIKMDGLAEQAIKALKQSEFKFVPDNWNKTYLQWLENIQDWCISRQLWWGHQIPVWYDDAGTHYVGNSEAEVRQKNNIPATTALSQDNDVLDTWFTAALCPFASLGWPAETPDMAHFYPNHVMVTGFDIIFFWVARMVMFGLYFLKKVPFKSVYIHGLIRDSLGQKMSKSKGNVLDPVDLIDGIDLESLVTKRTQHLMQPQLAKQVEKQTRKNFPNGIAAHGTDALRFTFCALASTGRDINFDMGRMEGYRNFCNKLWNAARFVHMQIGDTAIDFKTIKPSITDQWITSRLNHTIKLANDHFEQYRFDLLAQTLYEFTWNEYCDWYLEFAKCTLQNSQATEIERNTTRYTLVCILENILRLLHPLIPFITEEIWQTVRPTLGLETGSIMLQSYPTEQAENSHVDAENCIDAVKKFVSSIRNLRSEMNISPAKKVDIYCVEQRSGCSLALQAQELFILNLGKLNQIHWNCSREDIPTSASALINDVEIFIPLAGNINKEAELTRLKKEKEKLDKELMSIESLLANPNYVNKAPAEVVKKAKAKALEVGLAVKHIESQQREISQL